VVVIVIVVVAMRAVAVTMSMPGRCIGPALGFEGALFFLHDEVHGAQHVGQHVVGFEQQAVRLQLQRHVAIGQVVGRAQQVTRRAVLAAGAHHQHRLRRGQHLDERAVLGHGHVATAQHRAAGQHEAELTAGRVHRVEAALLAQVPVQLHRRCTAQQHGGQALGLGDDFVDDQHARIVAAAGLCAPDAKTEGFARRQQLITVPGLRIAPEPMSPSPTSVVHRFPGWEIRPLERVLLLDGKPARVGSRAFDLLVALAERPARVVSKRELIELVWPDVVVEENNLSVQITALRKLLGAEAIVNVSGIGYTLAAEPLSSESTSRRTGSTEGAFSGPELVGRETEMMSLAPRVGVASLLTIVGTGGVGKTALARALMRLAVNDWRDGVHWIDLAAVQRGVPLLPLVSRSLGVLPDEEGLTSGEVWQSLSGLQALIALDNCEHVLDAVAECVAPLLRAAPGLRWLATSQEPLRLAGEEVYRLRPLQVIPPDADPALRLGCSALSLFVQRARSPDLDLEQDDRNVALLTGYHWRLKSPLHGWPRLVCVASTNS
jgi:DNA-binding winged helix-turn-helix (wHTH) protein